MMSFIKHKRWLFWVVAVLSACTAKGYPGFELPDDQLATVKLKAPVISLIPILNLLAGVCDDDWSETSSGYVFQVNKNDLNRFNKVMLNPGNTHIGAKNSHFIREEEIPGTRSTSYDSCSCTETEDKDKKKTRTCQRSVTTSWNTIVTARDEYCEMDYPVQANQAYELFVRKGDLVLQDDKLNLLKKGRCQTGSEYTYGSSSSSTSSESCFSLC